MSDDVREKARKFLGKVPPGGVQSNGDRALFQELTNGVTHEVLMANWETGGIRTVCIDFVCWYAAQMGINILSTIPANKKDPKTDGFFALEQTLKKAGKSHAFVRATDQGPRPKYGDIIRHVKFHVDMCEDFDGEVLLRVAGGQSSHPRPAASVKNEFDNILHVPLKRVDKYDATKLLGWLDIEKFFAAPEEVGPDTDKKAGSLWFNGNEDVVHPDAPLGAGGHGFFRHPGSKLIDTLMLPHPSSPAARTMDPLHLQRVADEENRLT